MTSSNENRPVAKEKSKIIPVLIGISCLLIGYGASILSEHLGFDSYYLDLILVAVLFFVIGRGTK